MSFLTEYSDILTTLENIRTKVVNDNIDTISFGGKMSDDDRNEINAVINIEHLIFNHLKDQIEIKPVENKPALRSIIVAGKTYTGLSKYLDDEMPVKPPRRRTVKEEVSEPPKIEESPKEDTPKKEPKNIEEKIEEPVIESVPMETDTVSEMTRAKNNGLLYQIMTIALTKKNGERELFDVMCAPLKLFKFSAPAVPIIISMIPKAGDGFRVTKSSYDSYTKNKTMIMMDIKGYNLLCRGTFNDKGEFNTSLSTTGNSAANGDKLELVDMFTVNTGDKEIGYPRVAYDSEEGDGNVYLFPLGKVGTNEFICMTKTDEFTNYYEINDLSEFPKIKDGNLTKSIHPVWDNDTLTIDLMEE